MAEVVRMSPEMEKAHLDKLLDKVEEAQLIRAKAITGEINHCSVPIAKTLYKDKLREYNFFKEAYGL